MTLDLSSPDVVAALARADLRPPPTGVGEQLQAAWASAGGPEEAVLDVSRAVWGNETYGPEEVLVVLLRKAAVLVEMRNKGLFGGARPRPRVMTLSDYNYVAEDDEVHGHSIFFLAPSEEDHFLVSWGHDAGERHRMFEAIFDAHRGNYGRWGVQLDPAEYGADFDRFHAHLVAEGPSDDRGSQLFDWAVAEYGDYDIVNALGLAVEWRDCELSDARGLDPSMRVVRLAHPEPWIDGGPEAERVFLRLGEELYDAGLLGSPYDQRSFDTAEPLSGSDAGPSRLLALMNLAALASRFDHPRAAQWVEAAAEGIPLVPPAVFPAVLRERWATIGRLPAVDESPPAEIPIHEDVDVKAISSFEGGQITYSQGGLSEEDGELIRAFFVADGQLNEGGPASAEDLVAVCLLGVRAFEGLSDGAPPGWRKLILYAVSDLTYDLWEKHEVADSAAKLAHWVLATIEARGWGPDGRSTPLGQHHSYAMGIAVRSGVGAVAIDPETGLATAATGEEARRAAIAGRF